MTEKGKRQTDGRQTIGGEMDSRQLDRDQANKRIRMY
jgi:hypothetical protein